MAMQWPADSHSTIDQKRDAFFSAINGWMSANLEKVQRIYLYGEGWERWMQTDWKDYLHQTYANITVERERQVWNNGQFLDFAILARNVGYTMELKCYICNASEAAWRQYLTEDFAKIDQAMVYPYNTYAKWVVGIRFDGNITPAGSWHTIPVTATSPNGLQINYWIDFRTLGGI